MNTLKETSNSAPSAASCKIQKPRKIVVPLAVGLAWKHDPDYVVQEKLDGRFETRQVRGVLEDLGDTLLAGEYMLGEFYAFDLLRMNGTDFRPYPLEHRLAFLDGVFAAEPIDSTGGIIRRVQSATDGGAFLVEVLARGGEGVVRKRLDSPWGTPMEACKRLETFTCIVTAMNAGQSVQISRILELESGSQNSNSSLLTPNSNCAPCGSVKLGGGKCDRVRVGSILKIEGFGLTREGKIREPRPCVDSANSFLIQY